jgi:hypothetical protein
MNQQMAEIILALNALFACSLSFLTNVKINKKTDITPITFIIA